MNDFNKNIFKNRFLALSATVGNTDYLQNWFNTVTKRKTILVQHSTRFLNLQRHVWSKNRQLDKIHPLSCLTFDNINETFLGSNIPFTPYDNIQLFKALQKSFESEIIQHLDINNVFQMKIKGLL